MMFYKHIGISFLLSALLFSSCSSKKIIKETAYTPRISYPDFPGGEEKYQQFIKDNVCYPAEEMSKRDWAYITANCLIRVDGSMLKVSTTSKNKDSFDKEVERVLKQMPKFIPGSAQTKSREVLCVMPIIFEIIKNGQEPHIFSRVEMRPQYPGGDTEFEKYVKNNIKYSFTDGLKNKKGTMVILFTLDDRTGKAKNFKLLNSFSTQCDSSVIDLLNNMPRWIPGKANGRSVDVLCRLIVRRNTSFYTSNVTSELEIYDLGSINTDILPEGFLDEIFTEKDKIRYFKPVYIIKEIKSESESGTITHSGNKKPK